MITKIYGHSDDLIEVDGEDWSKEIIANYGEPTYLLVNGVEIEVRYDKDGVWRFDYVNEEEVDDRFMITDMEGYTQKLVFDHEEPLSISKIVR